MNIFRQFNAFIISIILLYLAQLDMGKWGVVSFGAIFFVLIFMEMWFIRQTILNVYAEAITENRFLLFFMRGKFANSILSLIIATFLALNLLIHINIPQADDYLPFMRFLPFVFAGLLLFWFVRPLGSQLSKVLKEKPALAFNRAGSVFFVVCFIVLLDGVYGMFAIDGRIRGVFDSDIPIYVAEDIKHSWAYFQHLLRTLLYIDLNVQSIGLWEPGSEHWWVYLIKAIVSILSLSPTPYIAYTLALLSIRSIEIRVKRQ